MLNAILAVKSPSPFWMPDQASTVAPAVDGLYDFVYWLSLFFFFLITLLLITFILKYRHRPGVTRDPVAGHSTALELTWTIIPTILVFVIFYFGFRGFMNLSIIPPNAYEVQVTGQKWNWRFTYPSNVVSPDGKMHVPVNTPISLVTESVDVIHSFFIPAMRVKRDVVPGRYNRLWFEATETGEFDVYCAEYCGDRHSTMLTSVVVHTKDDFKKWLQDASIWVDKMSPIDAGFNFYKTRGCQSCHSIDGTANIGPTFKDLYNNPSIPITGQGTIKADENYIRESLLYPQAKVHQGFGPPSPMPSFLGALNDEDIGAIIAWMRTISSHNFGDLAEFKVIRGRGGKPATNPSATQPAGSVPRQEFNTRAPGQQPKVDPNTANDNTSQKKDDPNKPSGK
jgi:cytochrome c oxidase subunit 2